MNENLIDIPPRKSLSIRRKTHRKRNIDLLLETRINKCIYSDCRRSFKTKENLDEHIKSIHNQTQGFTCTYENCNNKYIRLGRLKIHQRTHTGEKPFKCNFNNCGKSFNEKGNLKTHLRVHTGEKPYVCTFQGCSNSFKALGHLKDHMKIHYNIRPFECEICKDRFSRLSTLKIHRYIHTGEKPHMCPFENCFKRFSEKGNMRSHYKTHLKKPGIRKIQKDKNIFIPEKSFQINPLLENENIEIKMPISQSLPKLEIIEKNEEIDLKNFDEKISIQNVFIGDPSLILNKENLDKLKKHVINLKEVGIMPNNIIVTNIVIGDQTINSDNKNNFTEIIEMIKNQNLTFPDVEKIKSMKIQRMNNNE